MKDERDSPPLIPSATPPKDERRGAATLRRHFDRDTWTAESREEARQKYEELGLDVSAPI
jgi:hypothetical protein